MNLPNALTIVRIILTFFFLYLLLSPDSMMKGMAVAVFLVASYTDYLDGKIARKTGQITPFGKLMDPIADKVLTLSAFLAFVHMDLVALWMAVLIILRDLSITAMRLFIPAGSEEIAARKSGKQKTAVQFAAIVAILLYVAVSETAFWDPEWTPTALRVIDVGMFFVVALTLWTGARYIWLNRKVWRNRKVSGGHA